MEKDKKIWFIQIDDSQEGPYSFWQLRADKRITPETLVWKEGFSNWVPIGKVKELKEVFADAKENPEMPENEQSQPPARDELALDMRFDPSSFFWLIILLVLLTYLFIQWFK